MFKILDGREHFFQWDLNQKLIVEDASITEVHFCNKTDECSLVCEVYEDNGQRVVDVPNILFQNDWPIRAYAYQVDHTRVEQRYKVLTRTKPADYVYTETEVKTWDSLEARVAELEENGGGGGAEEISVSANAPTDENIKVWINPDATGAEYALKSDIPTEDEINTLINTALGVIENGTY